MILSGKAIKADIVKQIGSKLVNKKLVLIAIGDNSSANSYVKGIKATGDLLDVNVEVANFSADITSDEVIEHLKFYNDNYCQGILMLTPVPDQIDLEYIKNFIDPKLDVDCMSAVNAGKFYLSNEEKVVAPSTAMAVMHILRYNKIALQGKSVCIVGASNIVGKPVAKLMLDAKATVIVCNKATLNLQEYTKQADIIVSCAGVAHLINKEHVRANQIIIDVGINFLEGKLVGDVNYEEVITITENVTKVPGGVGAITSAILFENMAVLNG